MMSVVFFFFKQKTAYEMRISDWSSDVCSSDLCLIATGIPYMGHGNMAQWSRIFGAVAPEVAGIRRFGAASLDLAWVAAGRYAGFWESDLQVWDVAAGMLLVREAGGFVRAFRCGARATARRGRKSAGRGKGGCERVK